MMHRSPVPKSPGTLVLRDEARREVITGWAAQLHRVYQAPQRFASREAFEAFTDFDHEIPTGFGMTHVVASGPKDAPPLVLLHGYLATSVMWAPNVAEFSRDHRVYAIDVMGQPGRSIPHEPIRDAADYVLPAALRAYKER